MRFCSRFLFCRFFHAQRPFYKEMNARQLVAAYAQGDEQAFADLARKFYPVVHATAMRRLNDPHLAEDVAQSVEDSGAAHS